MLTIDRILFPTDFSECAEHAFSYASKLAGRTEAEVHVLNVVPSRETLANDPMSYFPVAEEDVEQGVRIVEAEPVRHSGGKATATVQAQMLDSSPAEAILRYAEEHDIDLVVMGTHGRHGLTRWLMGSVAEEVVRRAPCPVLTVLFQPEAEEKPHVIRRIAVPVDFSDESQRAVAHAKALAQVFDASLGLLFVGEEHLVPIFSDTGIPSRTLRSGASCFSRCSTNTCMAPRSRSSPTAACSPRGSSCTRRRRAPR